MSSSEKPNCLHESFSSSSLLKQNYGKITQQVTHLVEKRHNMAAVTHFGYFSLKTSTIQYIKKPKKNLQNSCRFTVIMFSLQMLQLFGQSITTAN